MFVYLFSLVAKTGITKQQMTPPQTLTH